MGAVTPPASLDDPSGNDFTSAMVFSHVYETPITRDPSTGDMVPALFARPLHRSSGGQWEGTVRSNLRLSDGAPVTADELAHKLTHLMDSEGMRFTADGEIIRVTAPDVRDLNARLSRRGCALGFARAGKQLGTGPYGVVEASPELIILEANRHYPSTPSIKRVEIHCFPERRGGKDKLIDELNHKRLDLTVDLARADVDQVNGMRKVFRPGASTCVLAFNTQGRLSKANHRRAIAKILDLHALSEVNHQNSVAYLARGVLPPMLGHPRANNLFAPGEGAAEIAGANFGSPLKLLRVWAPRSYNPEPAGTATLIAQQLVNAGVAVTHVTPKTPQDYQSCLDAGDYDLVLGGWIADTAEPLDFYEALFSAASIPSASNNNPNSCNMARWDDPETTALLGALRQSGSASLHQKIEDKIADQRPLVPLMYGPSIAIHGWHVQGFAWGQQPFPSFTELELAK